MKISVVSSGRWDIGHIIPIIERLEHSDFDYFILAPANHSEICDKYASKTIKTGACVNALSDYGKFYGDCLKCFKEEEPDVVLVLGDRYEIHAAATAALLLNIKIIHVHAFEATAGAFDDELRNSISMMADYIFTSNEVYESRGRRTLNELYYGSKTWKKIYNVGAPCVSGIKNTELLLKRQIENDFSPIDIYSPFIIVLFNPVTKEQANSPLYIANLLKALYIWGEQAIIIMPNIDPSNQKIRTEIFKSKTYVNNWHICDNIDRIKFLSLMSYAHMMIGNSSSGIIESAYFNLPVVNIGTRQDGRIKPRNVFDCNYDYDDIYDTIEFVNNLNGNFDEDRPQYPYGDEFSADRLVSILKMELGGN